MILNGYVWKSGLNRGKPWDFLRSDLDEKPAHNKSRTSMETPLFSPIFWGDPLFQNSTHNSQGPVLKKAPCSKKRLEFCLVGGVESGDVVEGEKHVLSRWKLDRSQPRWAVKITGHLWNQYNGIGWDRAIFQWWAISPCNIHTHTHIYIYSSTVILQTSGCIEVVLCKCSGR